jgi:HK97 family phage major capsid protein
VDFATLLAGLNAQRATAQASFDALDTEARSILAAADADSQRSLTEAENARSLAIVGERAALRSQLADIDAQIGSVTAERDADAAATAAAQRSTRTGVDAPIRTAERGRTYNEENDRRGVQFALDVARSAFGDGAAQQRLATHMAEERDARGGELNLRATGTGAFSGIIVPQYLTELGTPLARAGRPLADVMNHHDLPEQGMTVYLPRATTGTSAADQAAEFDAVSETDYDDTLLTIPVRTAAGSQRLSRQAIERGVGVEDTVMQDLEGALDVNLDSGLINKATVGLSAAATGIAYTDASPTAVELYPKLLQGPAAVEAALLNAAVGDVVAVMHSRRWYWLQSQLTSTFPLFGQPGVAGNMSGVNYGEVYGKGFRGLLPSGVPVVVDNNIATNLGAGTNEDEIYFVSQSEAHLWEDPNAPRLIRAEQTAAKNLAVDLVLYSYYAFTFLRRPHAQKIGGTGLVTPAFA